jgi:hypothetical protein
MPTNLDVLRELAERTSKDHAAGSTDKWCYLCLWGWPCPPHTLARALLAALDVVEAAENRNDRRTAKSWRQEDAEEVQLSRAIASFKEVTDG